MTNEQLQALCYLVEALGDELAAGSLRGTSPHPHMLADIPTPRIPHTLALTDALMVKAGLGSGKSSEALLRPIALEIMALKHAYQGDR